MELIITREMPTKGKAIHTGLSYNGNSVVKFSSDAIVKSISSCSKFDSFTHCKVTDSNNKSYYVLCTKIRTVITNTLLKFDTTEVSGIGLDPIEKKVKPNVSFRLKKYQVLFSDCMSFSISEVETIKGHKLVVISFI